MSIITVTDYCGKEIKVYLTQCEECGLPALGIVMTGIAREDEQICPFCGNFGLMHNQPYHKHAISWGAENRAALVAKDHVEVEKRQELAAKFVWMWYLLRQKEVRHLFEQMRSAIAFARKDSTLPDTMTARLEDLNGSKPRKIQLISGYEEKLPARGALIDLKEICQLLPAEERPPLWD